MEVTTITPQEIETEFNGCPNLAALIQVLEKKAAERGQVICQVEVNGLKMTEADEGTFATTPIAEIDEIVLQTENVEILIQASISSVRDWMARLKDECVETSEMFRQISSSDEQKRFAKLMDAYREMIQTLNVLQSHIAARTPEADAFAEKWTTSEMLTTNAVRELLAAYEQNDRILVADILEYELYNCLDRWLELIRLPN